MEYHYLKQNYVQWNTTDLADEEKNKSCLYYDLNYIERKNDLHDKHRVRNKYQYHNHLDIIYFHIFLKI